MSKSRYPLLLTLGSIGYLPGSGTIASAWGLAGYIFLRHYLQLTPHTYFGIIVTSTLCATAFLYRARTFIHDDPSEIVIDELIGMSWALLGAPLTLPALTARFILFRFFDITKFLIAPFERLPGIWGIMADDLAAAFLTYIVVLLWI